MATEDKISKDNIISLYMEFVLENNHQPKSVFSFAKDNNFEESDFYKFYASFEAIEEAIFSEFFHHTINVLAKSEDYENFDARNKLLSFYFTFFEMLTANRSYVVYALKDSQKDFKKLKSLKKLREDFIAYIKNLGIEKLDLKQEKLEKIQDKSIQESSWFHLLVTMKFWLDDTSAPFEKTDIFIEKSINARFDLMDIKPLKSIIDFGKFILKEKVNFN
ncbi:TetR/AcrR family transcriptional regulator [Polaribacter vadi]|uniref:TetR family transcriptional regulator C-terminal domain-containing protein n=1 Tax=Polaribacter TaxID=52959 RepID=UPI001C07FAC2|nr:MULTISPECIES: TetR family transcriptional regulator C-terminal domain-containing protein [Polaribacter]MBU3012824.1 TetR/AcrR family transcriptional regulator [Polaribacter vadi]MDO6742640.1 TetR family transcriptional regulator C-terminal domain-containing protein [Polaribacter sp. 1_MG-2023]